MSLSRRRTLALLGGGTILAATAGIAAFALSRTPTRALAPWAAAGHYRDPRMNALSWAILAPNPHNLQPWIAELVGTDGVIIHRDKARALPETDPLDRQITIGFGCFLELMIIAASASGHRIDLTLFPNGEGGPIASARFNAERVSPDPLFGHVAARRSCKEPYDQRPVPPDAVAVLSQEARILTEPGLVADLRKLTWDAWLIEASTPRTYKESVDLMRFGKREIETHPDGIDLGGPFLEALMLAGLLTRADQLDPKSAGYAQGVAVYKEMLAATPAYAVIATAGNTRVDQIAAGRRWLRFNLMTTGLGLALHPVSQALQEFPEMAETRARLHGLVGRPGETVQMLGRVGYGPKTPEAPRWALETRMRNA